jgi:hypothetical protein
MNKTMLVLVSVGATIAAIKLLKTYSPTTYAMVF